MRRLSVKLADRSYSIVIGERALDRLPDELSSLAPTRLLIVSDQNVAPRYAAALARKLAALAPVTTKVLHAGESSKTLATVEQVLDALFECSADRKSMVVALGGGVIGDVAGFAASIFMRGIRFVQVPTTLLAQVDSSVGGKTGVNHAAGKNLIGSFHQPSLVVADTATLTSLPTRELSAGLAEVIKHGLLADEHYFELVESRMSDLLACDAGLLEDIVARSCEIKADIVARDERESGERALLNLGHTFGHAIEALAGFGTWLHGEAVGCGLCLAADLSRRLDLLGGADVDRIEHAVARARLPTRIGGLGRSDALRAMAGDKKAEAGEVRFILLERIGRAVQRRVPADALDATLRAGGYT
jgi:3-dehydroquinate synthase